MSGSFMTKQIPAPRRQFSKRAAVDQYRSPPGKAADARRAGKTYFQWVTAAVPAPARPAKPHGRRASDRLPVRTRSETLAMIESQGWSEFSRLITCGSSPVSSVGTNSWSEIVDGTIGPDRVIYTFRMNPDAQPRPLPAIDGYDSRPDWA